MHQIRRHFAHLSHPLIGDTVYGDGKHNRIFRDLLGDRGLFLKAYSLEFIHPTTGQPLFISSRWNHLWHKAFDLFQACPLPVRPKLPVIT
jgi:tRNA pseudouridine65 synthase